MLPSPVHRARRARGEASHATAARHVDARPSWRSAIVRVNALELAGTAQRGTLQCVTSTGLDHVHAPVGIEAAAISFFRVFSAPTGRPWDRVVAVAALCRSGRRRADEDQLRTPSPSSAGPVRASAPGTRAP
jgi:hypothetical protein